MPRSPFVVAVTELVKHHGVQREVVVAGPLDGLELSSARVDATATVRFEGVLESLADGSLTATGEVRAPWSGECRRCLRRVDGELVSDLREVFCAAPVEGETYPLRPDSVDLEPMVRDAVLLALPLAPLCDDGCAGPDPEAHPVGVEGEGAAPSDPRWSALSALKFD